MAKIRCPGVGCSFESKSGLLSGFKGVICSNCGSEGNISWRGGDDKDFKCHRCGQLWYGIPCPECGTSIKNTLFLGIL